MHRHIAKRLFTAVVLVVGLCAARGAVAQHEEHQAGMHHGPAGAVAQLQFDQGSKWATDPALRQGMEAIRKAFDADHPAIHAGKETNEQYSKLAARIDEQLKSIVAQCKLPPAADANLHLVITDLMHGASVMRGEDASKTRHDGAALVHGALNGYGKYFDDPTWAPSKP